MMLTTRVSSLIGARAAVTASWYCVSPTERVLLLKMRSKLDVATVDEAPELSSWFMSLEAWKDWRLLLSGPPLVSEPPMAASATEAPSRRPDATSVAQRYR